MSFLKNYYEEVTKRLQDIADNDGALIEKAASLLYEAEVNNHKIYTFGTGHSHMIGQDIYARAGGYAKIYPIDEIELSLATHPTKSTHIERTTAYADVLDCVYTIHAGDVLIVTSNSGRNPLVVEYTLRAKERGAHIIAITSLTHSKQIASRHACGLRLFELADVVLDNRSCYGDATTQINDVTCMGPISTMSGCYLVQCVVGRFVEMLIENGMEAPVFRSSNMDGADAYNQVLFDKYVTKRIPD